MKKILYVRNGPYKVNPNLYNLQEIGFCKELCKMGYDCDIVYYSDENKDEYIYEYDKNRIKLLWRRGIKVLRTGIYPSLLKSNFVNQYDLVITTEYSQIMSLLWTRYNPKVILYNGPYYNLFKIPFTEKIYDLLFVKKLNKKLEKVFVKSEMSKEYLEKKGFSNVEVLGVGLDISVFEKNIDKSQEVENIISYMKSNECILYVGSLDERKNFRFTLSVFEEIQKTRPDVKLVIIGKGKKKYVDKCLESIDIKVRNNITIIEKVDNKLLKDIYPNAKVFVLPSKQEIFGMVLLEAMYFGVATVSSKNGGSTTLIRNGINGIIKDEFIKEEWAEEILSILMNEDYRKMLSSNAKETILKEYTWKAISSKFIDRISN